MKIINTIIHCTYLFVYFLLILSFNNRENELFKSNFTWIYKRNEIKSKFILNCALHTFI